MSAAEQQFIDMLKRIESVKTGAMAVIIRISALNAANRTQNHVQMTISALNEMIIKSQSSLFTLSNKDLAIIGHNIPHSMIEETQQSVLRIFQSDSFAASHAKDFIHVYHLKNDFNTVMKYAKEREAALSQTQQGNKNEVPLAPEYLDAILRNIQGFNILKIIRRQEAIEVTPDGGLSSLFLEYFTSMADLKKAIAPDVNVLSNRWLFQHLSETLDKRMLGISKELFEHTPKSISLNLNISTIFTPVFEQFLSEKPEDLSVIVEVQLMDIIQNTKNYFAAKDLLHDAGHKVLIDSLHPISFEFMDMKILDSDFMKLNWTPALNKESETQKLLEKLNGIDPAQLILMRCEDVDSLRWGLTNRVMRFQGYFIDELTAARTKRSCSGRKNCTRAQCVSRKAGISGHQRSGCFSPECLDLPIRYERKQD